jgi:hypothetical protein
MQPLGANGPDCLSEQQSGAIAHHKEHASGVLASGAGEKKSGTSARQFSHNEHFNCPLSVRFKQGRETGTVSDHTLRDRTISRHHLIHTEKRRCASAIRQSRNPWASRGRSG